METLTLYSTLNCHLCDLARDIIRPCLHGKEITLVSVDIASDAELRKKYGTRIPVLHSKKSLDSLYWPFDKPAVDDFIESVRALEANP